MRRTWVIGAIVVVVMAGGGAVWAATQASDAVTTIKGCVTSNGQLRAVAPADDGSTATCRAGEAAVVLSSGDITRIETAPDGGLTGGAAAGAASLALLPGYRLPQGCSSGSVIRYSSALQYWTCGSTFAPHAYEAFRQTVPFTVTAVGVFPGDRVLTLQVPPGKYVVTVELWTAKSDGSGVLRCNTFAEGPGATGNILISQTVGPATTMGGVSAESLPNGGTISTWCRQLAGATGSFPVVQLGEILASSVEDFSSTEDTSAAQYGG